MYNVLRILLHRPFVADGHLYGTLRDISVKSFMTCASAADRIVTLLRAYDCAFAVARAPYLISYACYVAATIHVRIAAKRGADSEAHNNLATCLAIFNRNRETNEAIRRAQHIIQGLMKRLGVPQPQPEYIANWSGKDELAARGITGPLPQVMSNAVDDGRRSQSGSRDQQASGLNPQEDHFSRSRNVPDGALEDVASVSPAVGWSDIDSIIQSFVRAPDAASQGVDLAYPFPGNAAESHAMDAPMQRAPNINTVRAQQYTYPEPDYGAWPAGMAYGSVSIDDMLFGLNGAALDSFQC